MAAKWCEGFETHQTITQMARKYATGTGSVTPQAGRAFGSSGGPGANMILVTPSLGLADTAVFGFGLRIASQQTGLNSNAQGLYVERGSAEQFHIEFVNNAGSFEVRLLRGSTTIATTAEAFAYGVWHYFELRADALTAAAAYELRHNEVNVLSGSGANLANSGSNQWDIFAFRFVTNVSSTVFFDDCYVVDTTGAANNDFLGDSIIEGVLPNANGDTIQWTNDAGSGLNWENVDDPGNTAPDESGPGGTNSSDTVAQKDLYHFQDLTQIQGNIHFVQVGVQLGMSAAGSRTVDVKFKDDGGTEVAIETHTVNNPVFDEFVTVLDQNPATASAWDVTDISGGQFGVEVDS